MSAGQAFTVAANVAPTLKDLAGIEVFCRAVAVYATSCRLGGAPEYSVRALLVALSSSGRLRSQFRIDFLMQSSYLLMSYDAAELSLQVLDVAEAIGLGSEDRFLSSGRIAVARGSALFYLGEHQESERLFEIGLRYLDGQVCCRYEGAVHHNLARVHLKTKKFGLAALELGRARDLFEKGDLFDLGMLDWTYGCWARECGQEEYAYERFRDAVGKLAKINPFNSALACLDWIELLLDNGSATEAVEVAMGMASVMDPLESNPIANKAVLALRKAAARGRVEVGLVQAVRERVRSGRRSGIRPQG